MSVNGVSRPLTERRCSRIKAVAWALPLAILLLLAASLGCDLLETPEPPPAAIPTRPAATVAPALPPTPEPAQPVTPSEGGLVLQVAVAPVPADLPEYDRGEWRHWTDEDGDCQNARQEVLIDESNAAVEFTSNDQCRVSSGQWQGPYTGEVVTDPGDLDIDHMVPLANAHRSGAWAWDRERKREYANSLGYENHLIATISSANRAKGSKGPEAWRPPLESYWCAYAIDWVTIKNNWELTVTESEYTALREMLATCPMPALLQRGGSGQPVNATAVPTSVPSATETPTPHPTISPDLRYDPFGPDRDCGDFDTYQEALDFYMAAGGPAEDPHNLDSDGDGKPCDSLPRSQFRGQSVMFARSGISEFSVPASFRPGLALSPMAPHSMPTTATSDTLTAAPTPTPPSAPAPTPALSPMPTPTATAAPTFTPNPVPEPTKTPIPSPTPEPTQTPIPSPTPEPTQTPIPNPTPGPTPEPTSAPTPMPGPMFEPMSTLTAAPLSRPTFSEMPFDPYGSDRSCDDFASWWEAQNFYYAAGGPDSDPHLLDGNGDGIACQFLLDASASAPGPSEPALESVPTRNTFVDRNCGDFDTWQQAQDFFLSEGGPEDDRHGLDRDGDGIACQGLPGAAGEEPVASSGTDETTPPGDDGFADRNCGDFDTWRQAQDFFLSEGGPEDDPHGLDRDGDGIACQGLPGAPVEEPVASSGTDETTPPGDDGFVDRNCGDFDTWRQAQDFFLSEGGPEDDPHGLDRDGDGIACQGLPGAPGEEPVASSGTDETTPPGDDGFVDRNCGDFDTWRQAQDFFLSEGGPEDDPHGLDRDGDGIACQGLPGAPGEEPVASSGTDETTPPGDDGFVDRNCGDFDTWRQAQDFFLSEGGPEDDPHGLDRNNDGIACESLPGAP